MVYLRKASFWAEEFVSRFIYIQWKHISNAVLPVKGTKSMVLFLMSFWRKDVGFPQRLIVLHRGKFF